tara:strand:- start:558 stop:680 length:123 start_codon:yes stop_codon:yes gene_type:complete
MPNKKAKDRKRKRLKLNAQLKQVGRTKKQIERKKRKSANK